MNFKEIRLDTKELPSPEPMQAVINSLHKIDNFTYIKMIHRMEPKPLFNILKNNGFDYIVKFSSEQEIEIYIFKQKSEEIKKYIKGLL